MTDPRVTLAGRELGALPISVGTSLALEAYKTDPKQHYLHLYVNVHTLFRNLYTSLQAVDAERISKVAWAETLVEEIELLKRIVLETNPNLTVIYYAPTYDNLHKLLPKALFRPVRTAKQIHYKEVSDDVIKSLKFFLPRLATSKIGIEFVENQPPTIKNHSLVITHFAVDLLACPWNARLLESHTGKVKDRSQWSTKLAGSLDYSIIPFNKLTLTVFGDNSLIAPQPQVARKDLYAVAVEKKWTPVTTYDYVQRSVKAMRDYGMRDLFTSMF